MFESFFNIPNKKPGIKPGSLFGGGGRIAHSTAVLLRRTGSNLFFNKKKTACINADGLLLAEEEGFEPSLELSPH